MFKVCRRSETVDRAVQSAAYLNSTGYLSHRYRVRTSPSNVIMKPWRELRYNFTLGGLEELEFAGHVSRLG